MKTLDDNACMTPTLPGMRHVSLLASSFSAEGFIGLGPDMEVIQLPHRRPADSSATLNSG